MASYRNWGLVIGWASLIFIFSSEWFSASNTSQIVDPLLSWLFPRLSAARIESVNLSIRKLGHVSEYFVLAVLLLRALGYRRGSASGRRAIIWTLVLALVYALSDEFHQSFVPNRTASMGDVIIDFSGAICGIFWLRFLHRHV